VFGRGCQPGKTTGTALGCSIHLCWVTRTPQGAVRGATFKGDFITQNGACFVLGTGLYVRLDQKSVWEKAPQRSKKTLGNSSVCEWPKESQRSDYAVSQKREGQGQLD